MHEAAVSDLTPELIEELLASVTAVTVTAEYLPAM